MDKRIEAICGDAIAELQKMENESVNLIVTDPPYNLNKDYGTSQDKLKFEDYLEFSRLWLNEIYFLYIYYLRTRIGHGI